VEISDFKNIGEIRFPNTEREDRQASYTRADGYTFEPAEENGEMAAIAWVVIMYQGQKVARIKLSVCHFFFEYSKDS